MSGGNLVVPDVPVVISGGLVVGGLLVVSEVPGVVSGGLVVVPDGPVAVFGRKRKIYESLAKTQPLQLH